MSDRPTPETDDIERGNHVVPTEWAKQLERERDEAREKVEQQRKEIVRLNGATNHAGGTPLKIALRERDEALEKLSARWQSLRDSQDEVLRLTFENRELRNLSNE